MAAHGARAAHVVRLAPCAALYKEPEENESQVLASSAHTRQYTMFVLIFLMACVRAEDSGAVLLVTAAADVNATLNCTAVVKPRVRYHAVRWYKESVEPRLTGLVSMAMPAGTMRWYVGADTGVSLEEDTLSLKLPTVNCSDQGVYLCYLAAPVGEQNREGRVRLRVTGCPTEKPSEPENRLEDAHVVRAALRSTPTLGFLAGCGAIGMMAAFIVFFLFLLSYRGLKGALWTQTKAPGKQLHQNQNQNPPEKHNLLWISALDSPPKRPGMSAA
ncbi:uncharacterized protein [Eucyclogobius newberryi]|uniref:uncharacterized protein n=1 Tax=Eucyclogobius newberryi TaxID=166745 RepID=UPI003B5AA0B4